MREELDKALVEKYPKIFRDRYGDMKKTLMCWGFECGDGWYNIIDVLCANIQNHVDWQRKQRADALRFNRKLKLAIEMDSIEPFLQLGQVSDFWIKAAAENLKKKQFRDVPEKMHQVVAEQVKEKFGTLRFYYTGGDGTIDGMVIMAEAMSSVTCEVCGNPGKQRGGGWIKTLCVHCYEE